MLIIIIIIYIYIYLNSFIEGLLSIIFNISVANFLPPYFVIIKVVVIIDI